MGRNTHAIPYVLVVNANAVVPEIVEVARLPPGAPVVSISTYVELSTCAMGVALFEGVMEGVPLTLDVPEFEPVLVGVIDKEEPPEAVPVGVSLPLPVGDRLTVRVPVSVLEPVRVFDGVPEGVNDGDGVADGEAPPEMVAVTEGV